MLFLKLTLAPLLIAAVSLLGQRFGQRIAGLLAGFPIIAGPIFVLLTLEQGRQFGYQAAGATLAGLSSFAVYALTYVWLCRRLSWLPTLLLSWLAFGLNSLLLSGADLSLTADVGLAAASLTLTYCWIPNTAAAGAGMKLPRGEILLRMAAGAGLVLVITGTAAASGPRLAGLLTPFPVAGSVLAACSHRLGGSHAATTLLRGMVGGLASLVAFFTVAAVLLMERGLGMAMAAGLAVAIAIQFVLLRLHTKAGATG